MLATGVGGLLGKSVGATVGAAVGTWIVSNIDRDRPSGRGIRCISCDSVYNVHMPKGMVKFRCPVCNRFLKLNFRKIH